MPETHNEPMSVLSGIAAVGSGIRGMSVLLDSARKKRFAIRAVGAPFEFKDDLRRRGYRWDPGDAEREKAWWIVVEDTEAELKWLAEHVFSKAVKLPTIHLVVRTQRMSPVGPP